MNDKGRDVSAPQLSLPALARQIGENWSQGDRKVLYPFIASNSFSLLLILLGHNKRQQFSTRHIAPRLFVLFIHSFNDKLLWENFPIPFPPSLVTNWVLDLIGTLLGLGLGDLGTGKG